MKCLNPFEVREVLQERTLGHHWPLLVSIPLKSGRCCKLQYATALQYIGRLNPFEVREVLQVFSPHPDQSHGVSIPLKSGRCCKRLIPTLSWTLSVSIPLKSGRCCKRFGTPMFSLLTSQSLWSQGGAARREDGHTQKSGTVSIPLKSGRCCKLEPRIQRLMLKRLNPFEVREVLQGCFTKLTY